MPTHLGKVQKKALASSAATCVCEKVRLRVQTGPPPSWSSPPRMRRSSGMGWVSMDWQERHSSRIRGSTLSNRTLRI